MGLIRISRRLLIRRVKIEGREVMGDSAFIRAFKVEMDAAAHQTLVDTYAWANNPSWGAPSRELLERAEEWAGRIEDCDMTWPVLKALASDE